MNQTDVFLLSMMVVVSAMAALTLSTTSDAGITRAGLFTLAVGGLGVVFYGYRVATSLTSGV